jgi:Fe-S oxidoreductase
MKEFEYKCFDCGITIYLKGTWEDADQVAKEHQRTFHDKEVHFHTDVEGICPICKEYVPPKHNFRRDRPKYAPMV